MLTDPIADLLSRIRNSIRSDKKIVSLPYSKEKYTIAKVMADHGYIKEVAIEKNNNFQTLKIMLKKDVAGDLTLKRISKPGQKIYIKSKDIKKVKSGLGIGIISTSQGIMTTGDARKKNLGGEFLCEIY